MGVESGEFNSGDGEVYQAPTVTVGDRLRTLAAEQQPEVGVHTLISNTEPLASPAFQDNAKERRRLAVEAGKVDKRSVESSATERAATEPKPKVREVPDWVRPSKKLWKPREKS